MHIGITGSSGLIGTHLCNALSSRGHRLTLFMRKPCSAAPALSGARVVQWDAGSGSPDTKYLSDLDAVVHLAGEPIASGRWSKRKKLAIRHSRVHGTRFLVDALRRADKLPPVLISASAVGYYGSRGDEGLNEESSMGVDFLAGVARDWEKEALKLTGLGARVVTARFGIVLSSKGGALPKMIPPFRFLLGAALGSGRQYMSWIHVDDAVNMIEYALQNEQVEGPLNVTAPTPVTNSEFSSLVGKVLHRPVFLRVPGFVLKLLLGEMAEALLLNGQRVEPQKALRAGYQFKFPELEGALRDLL